MIENLMVSDISNKQVMKNSSYTNYITVFPQYDEFTPTQADNQKDDANIALQKTKNIISSVLNLSKRHKQIPEYVEYKESKTYKEAQKFAMDNFGVELKLENNLELANWINENLTELSNSNKGNIVMPQNIKLCTKGLMHLLMGESSGVYSELTKTVYLEKYGFGDYSAQELKNNDTFQRILYHEIGHVNHLDKVSPEEAKKPSQAYTDFVEEHREEIIEFFFTEYYLKKEELIAETFAIVMQGKEVPDIIKKAYELAEGPDIFKE